MFSSCKSSLAMFCNCEIRISVSKLVARQLCFQHYGRVSPILRWQWVVSVNDRVNSGRHSQNGDIAVISKGNSDCGLVAFKDGDRDITRGVLPEECTEDALHERNYIGAPRNAKKILELTNSETASERENACNQLGSKNKSKTKRQKVLCKFLQMTTKIILKK